MMTERVVRDQRRRRRRRVGFLQYEFRCLGRAATLTLRSMGRRGLVFDQLLQVQQFLLTLLACSASVVSANVPRAFHVCGQRSENEKEQVGRTVIARGDAVLLLAKLAVHFSAAGRLLVGGRLGRTRGHGVARAHSTEDDGVCTPREGRERGRWK